jgi:hypothetical protein
MLNINDSKITYLNYYQIIYLNGAFIITSLSRSMIYFH